MDWIQIHPRANEAYLGYIPDFLNEDDPRPAKEQFNANYVSGRHSFKGFKVDPNTHNLHYPGDPPTLLLWETKLRDETIRVYEHAWVSITQPDGSVEIARLD